jgi:hypothetical protein
MPITPYMVLSHRRPNTLATRNARQLASPPTVKPKRINDSAKKCGADQADGRKHGAFGEE